ncbi:MAG: HNH endonuclease, partial [Syntrophaceae bacterium]|nr:HNH endonuclease [Syntrophaceae bacterium]
MMIKTPAEINRRQEVLRSLSDGIRTSKEIQKQMIDILGYPCPLSYVVNSALKLNLPRYLPITLRLGCDSPGWRHGRQLTCAGYALVPAPDKHPCKRKNGMILEHRLVMEQHLGRYLLPKEIVDHIDELHLHNSPENLCLFANSSEHLIFSLSGRCPQWSPLGFENVRR